MSPNRRKHGLGELIDPAVLAEADAESRMVRLPSMQRRLSIAGRAIAGVVFMVVMLALFNGAVYLKSHQGVAWMVVPSLIAAMAFLGWTHLVITHRRRTRRFRIALSKRGVPVCIECGYSLRGLQGAGASCPECGAKAPHSQRLQDSC